MVVTREGEGHGAPRGDDELPIDINYKQMIEWLVDRKKVSGDWRKKLAAVHTKVGLGVITPGWQFAHVEHTVINWMCFGYHSTPGGCQIAWTVLAALPVLCRWCFMRTNDVRRAANPYAKTAELARQLPASLARAGGTGVPDAALLHTEGEAPKWDYFRAVVVRDRILQGRGWHSRSRAVTSLPGRV
jgi:hypothetical protein